jgi:hypothetical protein
MSSVGKELIAALQGADLGELPVILKRVIDNHRKVCKLTDDAYERVMKNCLNCWDR